MYVYYYIIFIMNTEILNPTLSLPEINGNNGGNIVYMLMRGELRDTSPDSLIRAGAEPVSLSDIYKQYITQLIQGGHVEDTDKSSTLYDEGTASGLLRIILDYEKGEGINKLLTYLKGNPALMSGEISEEHTGIFPEGMGILQELGFEIRRKEYEIKPEEKEENDSTEETIRRPVTVQIIPPARDVLIKNLEKIYGSMKEEEAVLKEHKKKEKKPTIAEPVRLEEPMSPEEELELRSAIVRAIDQAIQKYPGLVYKAADIMHGKRGGGNGARVLEGYYEDILRSAIREIIILEDVKDFIERETTKMSNKEGAVEQACRDVMIRQEQEHDDLFIKGVNRAIRKCIISYFKGLRPEERRVKTKLPMLNPIWGNIRLKEAVHMVTVGGIVRLRGTNEALVDKYKDYQETLDETQRIVEDMIMSSEEKEILESIEELIAKEDEPITKKFLERLSPLIVLRLRQVSNVDYSRYNLPDKIKEDLEQIDEVYEIVSSVLSGEILSKLLCKLKRFFQHEYVEEFFPGMYEKLCDNFIQFIKDHTEDEERANITKEIKSLGEVFPNIVEDMRSRLIEEGELQKNSDQEDDYEEELDKEGYSPDQEDGHEEELDKEVYNLLIQRVAESYLRSLGCTVKKGVIDTMPEEMRDAFIRHVFKNGKEEIPLGNYLLTAMVTKPQSGRGMMKTHKELLTKEREHGPGAIIEDGSLVEWIIENLVMKFIQNPQNEIQNVASKEIKSTRIILDMLGILYKADMVNEQHRIRITGIDSRSLLYPVASGLWRKQNRKNATSKGEAQKQEETIKKEPEPEAILVEMELNSMRDDMRELVDLFVHSNIKPDHLSPDDTEEEIKGKAYSDMRNFLLQWVEYPTQTIYLGAKADKIKDARYVSVTTDIPLMVDVLNGFGFNTTLQDRRIVVAGFYPDTYINFVADSGVNTIDYQKKYDVAIKLQRRLNNIVDSLRDVANLQKNTHSYRPLPPPRGRSHPNRDKAIGEIANSVQSIVEEDSSSNSVARHLSELMYDISRNNIQGDQADIVLSGNKSDAIGMYKLLKWMDIPMQIYRLKDDGGTVVIRVNVSDLVNQKEIGELIPPNPVPSIPKKPEKVRIGGRRKERKRGGENRRQSNRPYISDKNPWGVRRGSVEKATGKRRRNSQVL